MVFLGGEGRAIDNVSLARDQHLTVSSVNMGEVNSNF